MLQGNIALRSLLVVDDRMPRAEGTPLHVLSADPHVIALTSANLTSQYVEFGF